VGETFVGLSHLRELLVVVGQKKRKWIMMKTIKVAGEEVKDWDWD
jgi:hypothetical protein